ncbi:chromate transporter [Acinetobacter gerneri]|jgi:chromate transporter|uniref:chromate transporter n=1 Tax=Acinetobacter gerneri TaxID=202952 RepID=UPI0023F01E59|nr:chromate transporter [Acinetobacter gerneri]MCH4244637.1 chromate transporter [Acinetobacter gerneri]
MKSEAMVLENLNIPSNKALFMGFMKLGLMGFGGVLPLAHRLIVEDQKWLNTEQFTNLLGICQILPGGNIINVAAAIGYEFHGFKGAFCSVLGLIFAPTVIVVLIYELYAQFQNIPSVKHMIEGLAAAAAGLLFATGLKMAKPIIKSYMTMTSIVLAFVFMIIFKIPLLLTLLILLAMNMLILGVKKS